jgi:hypothetical protein
MMARRPFDSETKQSAGLLDRRDVFICHASEDKQEVVLPLLEVLTERNITYWYDAAEIKWGDSLTGKVNEGLKISEYVLVILSKSFVAKNWPRYELESALNIEVVTGRVVVLLLLVGNEVEKKELLLEFPILNQKIYVTWEDNPTRVAIELANRVGRESQSPDPSQNASSPNITPGTEVLAGSDTSTEHRLSEEDVAVVLERLGKASASRWKSVAFTSRIFRNGLSVIVGS